VGWEYVLRRDYQRYRGVVDLKSNLILLFYGNIGVVDLALFILAIKMLYISI